MQDNIDIDVHILQRPAYIMHDVTSQIIWQISLFFSILHTILKKG